MHPDRDGSGVVNRLTLMQLRALDSACLLAVIGDAAGLLWAYLHDRIVFISGDSHPASFSPVSPPPLWLLFLGLGVIVVLLLVSALVIDPAISRAKAKAEAES